MSTVQRPVTAEQVAAWPLERGRGYTAESVEALREAAVAALHAAAEEVEALGFRLAEVQAEAASERPRLDVAAVVRQMTPAQLRQAGIEAVGRAIVDAEEQATLIEAKGRATATRAHQQVVQLIRLSLEALDQGSKPGYEARSLRQQLARLLSAVELAQPTKGTQPPSPA